jgi:hypothetical protein
MGTGKGSDLCKNGKNEKIKILPLPYPAPPCPVLPCPVILYSTPHRPIRPRPDLSWPTVPCPSLSYSILLCPVLSCLVPPSPTSIRHILSMPHHALSCHAMFCFGMPCHVISCHSLQRLDLQCPTPIWPPALSCRAMLCPAEFDHVLFYAALSETLSWQCFEVDVEELRWKPVHNFFNFL